MYRGKKFAPKARNYDFQLEGQEIWAQSYDIHIPASLDTPSAQLHDFSASVSDQYASSYVADCEVEIVSIQQATYKSQKNLSFITKIVRKEEGCKCKNNRCGNKYCTCVKKGLKCGIDCECINCDNHRFVNKPIRCSFGNIWVKRFQYNLKHGKL